ncbi:hypothetical protein EU528_03110, partial [Candidatus Thorarchaeota archaeon]
MGHEYASMQRMLNQLNKPPPNVGRLVEMNAICMMILIPALLQVERIAYSSPDGYTSVPLAVGAFALLFLVAVLEMVIAIVVFSGIGWMMNVPGFFAIGVIKELEGSEDCYRSVHVGFYRRTQGRILFSGPVLTVGLVLGGYMLFERLSTGVVLYSITATMLALLIIPSLSANILIGFIARMKQRKWETISDTQIYNDVELKRQKFPQLSSVPSVDEMEEILRNAKIGDAVAQSDAKIIDQVIGQST